jgi:hypothetical protein
LLLYNYYRPQYNFGEATTVTAIAGHPFIYDINIDENVLGSTYSWYIEGTSPDNGDIPVFEYTTTEEKNNDLEETLTTEQAGTYVVYVTNPELSDLRLQSEPITINIDCVPQSERDALIAFYDSTNGDKWQFYGDTWKKDTPVSTWEGVDVEDCHVVRLIFSVNFMAFDGVLPPQIGDLLYLKELLIANGETGLKGEIPPEIGKLENLEVLQLGGSGIGGKIPPQIGNLKSLRRLYLNDTEIEGEIPSEIGKLENLEHWLMGECHLSGSIPPELGNLSNLFWLNLCWNDLVGEIPPELEKIIESGSTNFINLIL